jgi:Zn-dependent M16 (insulinase) family peptidase
LLQDTFGVGLKGVAPENVSAVETLVLETLSKIAEEGFTQDAIEASLNSVEFELREFNTGSFPRGLSYMLGCMNKWIYDRDPTDGVKFEEPLQELKRQLATGVPVFQNLLKQYVISNMHRLTVEMRPDTQLESKNYEDELARLQSVKAKMLPDELEMVRQRQSLLRQAQEAQDPPEARATLPSLSLDDLERKEKEIPTEISTLDSVPVLTHPLQTNGIMYADIAFDMSDLSVEDWALLPVFSRLMLESGTSTLNDVQLSRRIGAQTGGVRMSFLNSPKLSPGVVSDPSAYVSKFVIRGKAVVDKIPNLLDIFHDILTDARLDNKKRALEILKESKIRMESSIASSGHSFASTRLSARYTLLGYMGEVTGGVTYMQSLGPLIEKAERDWPSILARLEGIRRKIVHKKHMIVNLTGDERTLSRANEHLGAFVGRFDSSLVDDSSAVRDLNALRLAVPDEGLVVPTQVNYVVKGGLLFAPGERVSGAASVVSNYLSKVDFVM